MIILRTHPLHIPSVVELSMHALRAAPKLSAGETILVSLTIAHISDGAPPIRFAMEFLRLRADRAGNVSRNIWGKAWPYVLHGQNCRQLRKPFDIRDIQVSNHNYGQGGPFVYVDPSDEAVIHELGLLV